jgi:predicted nucleotidyltransferase component of viral defense system
MAVRLELSDVHQKVRLIMSYGSQKSKLGANVSSQQQKMMESSQAIGKLTVESAQAIAQINQQAVQDMAAAFQEKVAELLKVKNPQEAFDLVHAQVLQDAAKQVTDYQAKVAKVMKANHDELSELADSLIQQSKMDLIHFVNDATANAPAGSDPYVSVFKTAFNNALQNFELIRASTADSFANFEKSVNNMNHLSKVTAPKKTPTKARSKK